MESDDGPNGLRDHGQGCLSFFLIWDFDFEVKTMGGDQEKSVIEKFLEENVLFLGPDPEIMEDHSLVPASDSSR